MHPPIGQDGSGDANRAHLSLVIPEEASGERLDRVLAELLPDLSRSQIQRLIAAREVMVDGKPAGKASQVAETGQRITLPNPPVRAPTAPRPQAIPIDILYEDDQIVAVDKPSGLLVHAGAGHSQGTLVNALLHHYADGLSSLGGVERPGIVHRLDKGTSGVIVAARSDEAHRALSRQFADRTVEKEYDAFVYGTPSQTEGTIDLALGRDRRDRTRMSPDTDRPRQALSRWKLQEELRGFSLLLVCPHSGRTHQVRAHLTAIGHPCIGDARYSGPQWKGVPAGWLRDAMRKFPRPALHARRLAIDHPTTGERMEFSAPMPDDLRGLLALLRGWRDGKR
ncbi:MAG: RluA family pseudouridine synthase [Acidobacteriota bacterium]